MFLPQFAKTQKVAFFWNHGSIDHVLLNDDHDLPDNVISVQNAIFGETIRDSEALLNTPVANVFIGDEIVVEEFSEPLTVVDYNPMGDDLIVLGADSLPVTVSSHKTQPNGNPDYWFASSCAFGGTLDRSLSTAA